MTIEELDRAIQTCEGINLHCLPDTLSEQSAQRAALDWLLARAKEAREELVQMWQQRLQTMNVGTIVSNTLEVEEAARANQVRLPPAKAA